MCAALSGHLSCVTALLEANASIDLQNQNGVSALILAARDGHGEVVTALIEANASIDLQDEWGDSALMLAAEKGYPSCVRSLLDVGAAAAARALLFAEWEKHDSIVEMLKPIAAEQCRQIDTILNELSTGLPIPARPFVSPQAKISAWRGGHPRWGLACDDRWNRESHPCFNPACCYPFPEESKKQYLDKMRKEIDNSKQYHGPYWCFSPPPFKGVQWVSDQLGPAEGEGAVRLRHADKHRVGTLLLLIIDGMKSSKLKDRTESESKSDSAAWINVLRCAQAAFESHDLRAIVLQFHLAMPFEESQYAEFFQPHYSSSDSEGTFSPRWRDLEDELERCRSATFNLLIQFWRREEFPQFTIEDNDDASAQKEAVKKLALLMWAFSDRYWLGGRHVCWLLRVSSADLGCQLVNPRSHLEDGPCPRQSSFDLQNPALKMGVCPAWHALMTYAELEDMSMCRKLRSCTRKVYTFLGQEHYDWTRQWRAGRATTLPELRERALRTDSFLEVQISKLVLRIAVEEGPMRNVCMDTLIPLLCKHVDRVFSLPSCYAPVRPTR